MKKNNKEIENVEEKNEKKVITKHIYHIVQRKEDSVWAVKLGGGKVLKLCDTQDEAIKYAKEKANNQNGSIVIHKRDGKIRKLTY